MKKKTTWALFGTLTVNLALGFAVVLLFSATPAVQAAEAPPAAAHAPAPPAKQDAKKVDHLVAVRMGWSLG